MKVSVAYAKPEQQVWLHLEVPEGSTVQYVIEQSGITQKFPDINLDEQKVGVFGKFVKLNAPLKEGDRVEIYCPITCDPKTVPRRDTEDDDDD